MHNLHQPERSVGVDMVEGNIKACKASFSSVSGLSYRVGSAEAIPLKDGEANVVISVEASHCYANLERFLTEAHRVLQPDGYLLWTDFAPTSEMEERRKLAAQYFDIVEDRDITENVLRAMRKDAERRKDLIRQHASPWLRSTLLHFAAAGEEQESYQDFVNKKDCYFLLRLRANRGPEGPR